MQATGSNSNLEVDFSTVQGEISDRRHRKIQLWVHDVWVKTESTWLSWALPDLRLSIGHGQQSTEHSWGASAPNGHGADTEP